MRITDHTKAEILLTKIEGKSLLYKLSEWGRDKGNNLIEKALEEPEKTLILLGLIAASIDVLAAIKRASRI